MIVIPCQKNCCHDQCWYEGATPPRDNRRVSESDLFSLKVSMFNNLARSGLSNTHLTSIGSSEMDGERNPVARDESAEPLDEDDNLDEEEFIYPGASADEPEVEHVEPPRQPQPPSPAQLESLYAAASSGDLPLLKRLFRNALDSGDVEPFGLANDASSRTGFTALHAAASRGYLEIVMWCKIAVSVPKESANIQIVVEDCGAMPDLEDREGEVSEMTCPCRFVLTLQFRQLYTRQLSMATCQL